MRQIYHTGECLLRGAAKLCEYQLNMIDEDIEQRARIFQRLEIPEAASPPTRANKSGRGVGLIALELFLTKHLDKLAILHLDSTCSSTRGQKFQCPSDEAANHRLMLLIVPRRTLHTRLLCT